jgi:hypothetical protein
LDEDDDDELDNMLASLESVVKKREGSSNEKNKVRREGAPDLDKLLSQLAQEIDNV